MVDPVERGPNRAIARRVAPRMLGDLLAVTVGLMVLPVVKGIFPRTEVLFAFGYFVFAVLMDVTHVRREWNYVEEFTLALKTAFIALLLVAVGGFLVDHRISRVLFCSIALAMLVTRPLAAMVVDRATRSAPVDRRLVVICSDEEYQELAAALGSGGLPATVVRLHDDLPDDLMGMSDGKTVAVESTDRMVQLCEDLRPAKVVVGESHLRDAVFLTELAMVNEMGFPVRSFSRSFEEDFGRVPIACLDTSWFLFDISPLHRLGYRLGRRLVDLVAGVLVGAALILFLPLIALVIRVDSRGPVFFAQGRVGQRGRRFDIYKFRTMRVDAERDGPQFACARDHRMTRVGRLLRRSRIDEMPQALNLLRGDMSLIGPRPERPEFVELFRDAIPFYDKRSLIKPGITGWAQVHEGYGSSVEDTIRKLERDLYYLRHQSLGIDLRILMATVASVVGFAGR